MDCVAPPLKGGRRNPSVSSSRFLVATGSVAKGDQPQRWVVNPLPEAAEHRGGSSDVPGRIMVAAWPGER